jgi:hypothetical protein
MSTSIIAAIVISAAAVTLAAIVGTTAWLRWPRRAVVQKPAFCCLDTDTYCANCAKGVHGACPECLYDSEIPATTPAADGQTSDQSH